MKIRNWMLPQFVFNFATPASAVTGADGAGGSGAGGEGSGAGAGGGAPSTGTPAVPQGPDWSAPTVPAQLREGYNKLKADYEKLQADHKPWQSLNVKPDEVGRYQQSYQQVYTELKGIGDSLGIEEAEVADAIRVHGLLPVLDRLRYEAQQSDAAGSGDQAAIQQQELEERIHAGIEQRLSPVLQRENQRMVHEANTLTENTITRLATDAFKAGGMDFAAAPPELRDFILTGVTEALKYDDAALKSIKFEGKTAGIQRAFQTFTAMWDAAYLARRTMEGKVVPGARQGQPRPAGVAPGKSPTIDEIINDPNKVREAQGRPAYST
jgi:hypothetical protein